MKRNKRDSAGRGEQAPETRAVEGTATPSSAGASRWRRVGIWTLGAVVGALIVYVVGDVYTGGKLWIRTPAEVRLEVGVRYLEGLYVNNRGDRVDYVTVLHDAVSQCHEPATIVRDISTDKNLSPLTIRDVSFIVTTEARLDSLRISYREADLGPMRTQARVIAPSGIEASLSGGEVGPDGRLGWTVDVESVPAGTTILTVRSERSNQWSADQLQVGPVVARGVSDPAFRRVNVPARRVTEVEAAAFLVPASQLRHNVPFTLHQHDTVQFAVGTLDGKLPLCAGSAGTRGPVQAGVPSVSKESGEGKAHAP